MLCRITKIYCSKCNEQSEIHKKKKEKKERQTKERNTIVRGE
jgi:hypothetical protein